MKKLIVDLHGARRINTGKCKLSFNMRKKDGVDNQKIAEDKFLNQLFWVAEPVRRIYNHESKYFIGEYHFACDPIPEGWYSNVLPQKGSYIDFGMHRHIVKCTSIEVLGFNAGSIFTVLVGLELQQ